jgi:DNA end-binding protein Ku
MPRVIWKGQLSFGLVEIQVGLYSATTSDHVSFSLLDKRDMSPVGYKKINKKTGEDVSAKDMVRGYEIEEDQYVVLTDEDLEAANVKATHTIDVVAFCEAAEIDIRYFDTPYYLAPTKKGSKAYALLRETLKRTGKVGIARVVMRSRQYVACVTPYEDILVLDIMRYAHEVKNPKELEVPGEDLEKLGVRETELKMAEMLVDSLTQEFDPTQWRDEYRDDLMAMIEEKARTGTTPVAKLTEEGDEEPKVVDLMALLKKSVEAGKKPAKKESKEEPDEAEAHKQHHAPRKKKASAR